MPCGQEDIAAMTGYTLGGGYQPPAGGTVHLAHSGGYVIYYEGAGARSRNIPSFNVHLTPASPGASVSGLTHYRASVNYSVGSHDGRAVSRSTSRARASSRSRRPVVKAPAPT